MFPMQCVLSALCLLLIILRSTFQILSSSRSPAHSEFTLLSFLSLKDFLIANMYRPFWAVFQYTLLETSSLGMIDQKHLVAVLYQLLCHLLVRQRTGLWEKLKNKHSQWYTMSEYILKLRLHYSTEIHFRMLFRGGLIFGNLFLLNDKYVPVCMYVSMNAQFAFPVK